MARSRRLSGEDDPLGAPVRAHRFPRKLQPSVAFDPAALQTAELLHRLLQVNCVTPIVRTASATA